MGPVDKFTGSTWTGAIIGADVDSEDLTFKGKSETGNRLLNKPEKHFQLSSTKVQARQSKPTAMPCRGFAALNPAHVQHTGFTQTVEELSEGAGNNAICPRPIDAVRAKNARRRQSWTTMYLAQRNKTIERNA